VQTRVVVALGWQVGVQWGMRAHLSRAGLFGLLWLMLPSLPCAADPPSLFPATIPWTLFRPTATSALLTVPKDPQFPGSQVLQIDITQRVEPFYMLQLTRPLKGQVKMNDLLRYTFWARATNSNRVRVVIESDKPPYPGLLGQWIQLTDQWKPYTVEASVDNLVPTPIAARLQIGESDGRVEFAKIDVQDMGLDPAVGQAAKLITATAEVARIRKYRMGDLSVTVLSAAGRPVPGAAVHLQQTEHAFLFGCNFFGLQPDNSDPLQVAYRDEFTALFNYATLPFYWNSFEYQPGVPDYSRLSAMAEWCNDHNIVTKGHPLVWHQAYPAWGPPLPDDAIALLHARVSAIVEHYRPTIRRWDVVNEANSAAAQNPPNGESRWIERDGAARVVEMALGWARQAGEGADETFIYNDYDTGPSNVATLLQMQHDHQLPDTIGLQSHMHQGTWPLTKVWMVCQTFAQFGRPLNFTETTVLSGPLRPDVSSDGPYPTDWVTTPQGEQAQADYVIQFYTVLFSHPAVHAITWWDFSDQGAWQNAPAGLVRKDMSPKPAYTRLMQLIHHTWWSTVDGKTAASGRYGAHVFYGAYTIAVTVHGRTVTKDVWFPEGSGSLKTVIRLAQ
jgi:GH35 family endo-1,4-beta-xylanase